MGMMSTMPLNREMMWAGTACSVEVKYSLSPYSAISCSLRLFSLLNTAVMGAAPQQIPAYSVREMKTAVASPYRSIPLILAESPRP